MNVKDIKFGEKRCLNLSLEKPLAPAAARALLDDDGGRLYAVRGDRLLLLDTPAAGDDGTLALTAMTSDAADLLQRIGPAEGRVLLSVAHVQGTDVLIDAHIFTEHRTYEAAPLTISLGGDFRLSAANNPRAHWTDKDLAPRMEEEFLCDGRLFVQVTGEATGILLGSHFSCPVRYDGATGVLRAVELRTLRPQQAASIRSVRLVSGKIVFADGIAKLQEAAQTLFEENRAQNQEFEAIWNAYEQAELAAAEEDANETGFFAYELVSHSSEAVVLHLVERPAPEAIRTFLQSSQGYAACEKKAFETARREADERQREAVEVDGAEKTPDGPSVLAILAVLREGEERAETPFLGDEAEWDAKRQRLTFRREEEDDDPLPAHGYVFASFAGSRTMHQRRTQAREAIEQQQTQLPGLRTLIASGKSLAVQGKTHKVIVNKKLVKSIFDKKDSHFTGHQLDAIDIAINTPDIAIIQGPPGTGKTTILRAIVQRLHQIYPNHLNILISSTQNVAVDNAIQGMTLSGLPPVRITGRSRKAMSGDRENKAAWIGRLTERCDALLAAAPEDKQRALHRHAYQLIATIRAQGMDGFGANQKRMAELLALLAKLGADDAFADRCQALKEAAIAARAGRQETESEAGDLATLLARQSATSAAYLADDEGRKAVAELQMALRFLHEPQKSKLARCIRGDWQALRRARKNRLPEKFDAIFDMFRADIGRLQAAVGTPAPTPAAQPLDKDLDALLDDMKSFIDRFSLSHRTLYDVLWDFRDALGNPAGIERVLEKYAEVKAATCQQAAVTRRRNLFAQSGDNAYDYVIIDEAARSNPLDLLIPMVRGQHIILVGDQAQLPHMLEKDITREALKHFDKKDRPHMKELLEESLFQRLYRMMKRADGPSRVTMLVDQYRMHPVIGSFVSREFYDGKLKDGVKAEDRALAAGLFGDKPVAWLDVPRSAGEEARKDTSYHRPAEVRRVLAAVQELQRKAPGRSIGIITFYKAQVAAIQKALEDAQLPPVECNTVDAFQGKEFDIVILSTVRSNTALEKKARVGFLDSKNRLCVAFSRAKRLLVCIGDRATVAGSETHSVIAPFAHFYQLCKKEGYCG